MTIATRAIAYSDGGVAVSKCGRYLAAVVEWEGSAASSPAFDSSSNHLANSQQQQQQQQQRIPPLPASRDVASTPTPSRSRPSSNNSPLRPSPSSSSPSPTTRRGLQIMRIDGKRGGQVVARLPLPPLLFWGVTSVALSPTDRLVCLGYGVQSSGVGDRMGVPLVHSVPRSSSSSPLSPSLVCRPRRRRRRR